MRIHLVSTYEGGMQPLGVSVATAHLMAAGYDPIAHDAYLEAVSPQNLAGADLLGLSVPLFDSLEPAVELVEGLREAGWRGKAVFYGTYAMLNRDDLLDGPADGVVLGDWEDVLVQAADLLRDGRPLEGVPGLATRGTDASPTYARDRRLIPDRSKLPGLERYSYTEASRRLGKEVVFANVEATRGCRFACKYCSVFATFRTKVVVVPADVVLADIDQVVGMGAEHICFVDAEFLNAPGHALSIVESMHERYPSLTFDFTTRADLLATDPGRVDRLVAAGAKFVTTAFEFPKQRVLDAIDKGFTVQTLVDAANACRRAGLGLNPTFLYFNPWIDYEDLGLFREFLEANGLTGDIEPIQLQTRLWLYKNSPLLNSSEVQGMITDENAFNYDWAHPDYRVEREYQSARAGQAPGSKQRCCLKC